MILERLRARAWSTGRRIVRGVAPRLGLEVYDPAFEHRVHLQAVTEYVSDERPVRDKRPDTVIEGRRDLTITTEGLEDILGTEQFRGTRILEVGPKYGIHSLWLDRNLAPAELVFSDFEAGRHLYEEWVSRLSSPHRWVYGDLSRAEELLELERFDLVLFLGVLYHSVHHIQMLSRLNRVTRLGGQMLLESTLDPRGDASVRVYWTANRKAKAVPTFDALRVMLAWTGWRRIRHFTDYRPGASEAVLLCEKTDELEDETSFSWVVSPQLAERRSDASSESPWPAERR